MSCYALVPAAGGGSRMSAVRPKQYLPLAGRPLLYHALATLCAVPAIAEVYVVLAPDDSYWQDADYAELAPKLRVLRCGGATRALSVVNGLRAMVGALAADDWLLVHDGARACLTVAHVETLIDEVADDPVGGLLAVPVADTLKRDERGRIAATVARENLWQAQTPQMFRYGLLRDALEFAPAVTDEAGAIEALGLHPKLVAGDTTNFKITYPLDLSLAEAILQHRGHRDE
jgi:2-C-methyl-D-erythritol 4-phosphate cytidylyltransferase